MSKAAHQRALDILIHRCGTWSRVYLRDGRVCMVLDIGWGVDLGEEVAHITTNWSPGPNPDDDVSFHWTEDFFHADEVVKVEDAETGTVLLDLGAV